MFENEEMDYGLTDGMSERDKRMLNCRERTLCIGVTSATVPFRVSGLASLYALPR